MLPRWDTEVYDINNFLDVTDKLLEQTDVSSLKNRRGQPVKSDPKDYLRLVLVKEFKNCALRDAEVDWSFFVCRRRIDHSVIHYWEKKVGREFIENLVRKLGKMLEDTIGYDFSFVDSTLFTTWNKKEVEFYTAVRIAKETLYPVGLLFDQSKMPSLAIKRCLTEGNGDLLADAWYDDNRSFGIMFNKGYNPIVKPNKDRWKGHWRKKARRLYRHPIGMQKYRQRGRGESLYGTLTNQFGDRLKAKLYKTSMTRIGCRVLCYMIRIYMRVCRISVNVFFMWIN